MNDMKKEKLPQNVNALWMNVNRDQVEQQQCKVSEKEIIFIDKNVRNKMNDAKYGNKHFIIYMFHI